MSQTKIVHKETWTLTITPEKDDPSWPAEHVTRWTGTRLKPDTIIVHFERGQGRYNGSVSGQRISKNGRVSETQRSTDQFYGGGPPDWAKPIIEGELSGARLIGTLLGA